MERLVLGNTDGLKREDFTCILKQSMEKPCMTVLNISGWTKSGVHPFDHNIVWSVHKIDIAEAAAALAADEPLTQTTKLS